jgi:transposase-like protein
MSALTPVCPHCQSRYRQTKAGRGGNGNQRYQCQDCKRYYVAVNRRYRYPVAVRQEAANLFRQGLCCREIARRLSVNHQTIANWVEAHRPEY